MQMAGSFAEFERAMIRERTSAGIAAARAEGRIGERREADHGIGSAVEWSFFLVKGEPG